MNSLPPSSSPSDGRPLLHGVDWAVRAGATDAVMRGVRRRVRRRRQQRLALTGAIGAGLLGVVAWFSFGARPGALGDIVVASAKIAMPVRQTLPDGSVVELKARAEISVAYAPGVRRVALLRGEAHFLVMEDKTRPFIVAVGSVEVRAVGTSFSVQRGPAEVEVVVTTGRVAVDRVAGVKPDDSTPATQTIATVDAGSRTLVEVAPTAAAPVIVQPLSAVQMSQRLAWRIPRLEFTRTPLAEVIAMINEHSAIKLALGDPALGRVRISGLLRADNVETLFQLLEVEHGIKADHLGATEVILRPGR
jgi:transmembrane sensor